MRHWQICPSSTHFRVQQMQKAAAWGWSKETKIEKDTIHRSQCTVYCHRCPWFPLVRALVCLQCRISAASNLRGSSANKKGPSDNRRSVIVAGNDWHSGEATGARDRMSLASAMAATTSGKGRGPLRKQDISRFVVAFEGSILRASLSRPPLVQFVVRSLEMGGRGMPPQNAVSGSSGTSSGVPRPS